MTVEVPFRVAALGGKVPVELEVSEQCETCRGNGAAPGATLKTCPECNGRGTISFGQGGFAVNRPCPMCLGRGQIPSERCPTCGGAGSVRTRKRVNVTVPAGADSGTRVRLKGQGGRGEQGGAPGDLVITFQVQPDRLFRREGLDVIATVPINVAQATLGSKMHVRTLDGTKVALRIPAGTSSGPSVPRAGAGRGEGRAPRRHDRRGEGHGARAAHRRAAGEDARVRRRRRDQVLTPPAGARLGRARSLTQGIIPRSANHPNWHSARQKINTRTNA
jgi:molecular chaperone DnaJ